MSKYDEINFDRTKPQYTRVFEYNRDKAVAYAHKWAFGRNPAYFDFSNIGAFLL